MKEKLSIELQEKLNEFLDFKEEGLLQLKKALSFEEFSYNQSEINEVQSFYEKNRNQKTRCLIYR